jgi:GT2 family glycosyltransferase
LLDEDFGSYLEDADFGLRSAIGGFAGVYAPDAVAKHAGSETLGAWSPAMVRLIARNQLLLVARHMPGGFRWPVLVAQSLWGLTALRHGAFLAYLRGKVEGLRLFSKWRKRRSEAESQRLEELLRESERQLQDLQRQTGFDLYWRIYFALTSRGGAQQ